MKEKVSFHDIFYTFLFGCVMGWVIEGIWTLLKKGLLLNHSALIIGPFNVIYGLGAILLTLVLYKQKEKRNFTIFTLSMATGTILEYVVSFVMEYVLGFVAWNYKNKPFNINGRVCLPYSLFWGFLGVFWIKICFPYLKKIIDKFNKEDSVLFMKLMIIFLICDMFLTFGAIARGKAYEKGIEPQNKIEEIYDKYFGIEYLNNMFNNRWNKK